MEAEMMSRKKTLRSGNPKTTDKEQISEIKAQLKALSKQLDALEKKNAT